MQYAPTQANLYHPSIQYAYPCRCVLHTPHKHSVRDEWIDLKSENVHPFLLEMTGGRMQYAPTQVHLYHLSIKYVYPCRGVMLTPHKYSVRDECISNEFPNDFPFSLETIDGRMQYAPTQAHLYHPSIKCAYPCRGVMLTPHNHPARNEWIDQESKNIHPFPLETTGGRMQYAPTQAHLYLTSIKYMYPCRGVLLTPHNHPARDDWIDQESKNIYPFPLETIEGRMQYAST